MSDSTRGAEREPTTGGRCSRTVDIGAYLLGGLPQDEAVTLRHHIDGCASCHAALVELRPLTDRMSAVDLRSFAGLTVEQPPAELRDRILQRASIEGAVQSNSSSHALSGADTSTTPSHERSHGSPRSPRARRLTVAVASASIFAVGAGTGWGAHLAASPSAPPSTRRVYWGTGTESAPQRVTFATSGGTGPRAWASVSSGPAGTYAALYTKGLSPNVTYRWWFEKVDGTRVPLGSFLFPAGQTDWVVCPGGTSVERVALRAIGATNPDGVDVLRADLPPVSATTS